MAKRTIGGGRTFSAQPDSGFDWTSFDPNAWWQTPGLESMFSQPWSGERAEDWALGVPRGVLPDDNRFLTLSNPLAPEHTYGGMGPLEFYESWSDLSPGSQATFAEKWGLPMGDGGAGAGEGDMWGTIEPLEIPGIPAEDLARVQQWLDEVSGSFEARLDPGFSIWDPELTARVTERASPEYTGFSPEQRGAFEESIGGQLALAQRRIGETMAQRGIRGSGLEAQLGMTAAGQAARGMGDIRAALASSDEATRTAALDRLTQMQAADEASRQWATQGLQGVQQFATTGLANMTTDAQNMVLDFAKMMGYPMMIGPEQHLLDPLGLSGTGMAREDATRMMLANFLRAAEEPDFFEKFLAGEGIENNWLRALLAA